MSELIHAVADNYFISVVAFCFLSGSVFKAVSAMVTNSSRERSRREIAAYIAEGSISAEQGERLIRADVSGHANRAA
jgi:hypothetical protein